MSLGLVITIAALAVATGLFVIAAVQLRRPIEPGRPRLVPWLGVQMFCVMLTVFMLAHLVSLLTGTPLVGRRGY